MKNIIKKTVCLAMLISCVFFSRTNTDIFAVANAANEFKNYLEYKIYDQEKTIIIRGTDSREQFGSAIAEGDLNGDGIDDLAIGSPYFSSMGAKNVKTEQGKVGIFFGAKGFETKSTADVKADIVITGERSNDQLGTSMVFGDFNGDGTDDIAIGSSSADKVYMFLGKKDKAFPQTIDLSLSTADVIFKSGELNESFGFALDMADLNNDGMSDLIIGAPNASQAGQAKSGKVYIVFGYRYPAHQFIYDFTKVTPSMILYGEKGFYRFGAGLAHGDTNGDKKPDVIVSAYLSDDGARKEVGKVYVFFGRDPSELTIFTKYPIELHGSNVTIVGEGMRNWFGFSVHADDINEDGRSDIAVGSFMYQSQDKTGKVHIFYGENLTSQNQNFSKSLRILGDNDKADIIGASVYMDDINADTKKDLIIGAPGIKKFGKDVPGYVYVYSNQSVKNKKEVSLNDKTPTLVIEGENSNDWFGSSVLTADLNKDGMRDLIIGAPNAYNKGSREGAIYIIMGGSGFPGDQKIINMNDSSLVSRGELIYKVMDEFNLAKNNKVFLASCRQNLEICFFEFLARTAFKKVKLDPLILYPDVSTSHKFYKEITDMTMLGFLEDYGNEFKGELKPDEKITRIEALKILLNSGGMLKWKEYAELKRELGNASAIYAQKTPYVDVSGRYYYMWWYPRYVNFAYLAGIIKSENYFRPNDAIKQSELNEWLSAIKKFRGDL